MGAAMDEILEHAKRMEQTMDTVRDVVTVCPDIHPVNDSPLILAKDVKRAQENEGEYIW